MFDGSHRTTKREINLSGASASSRKSRTTHLNLARQQRLARAQAKAKLNAAKVIQRCWRGVRPGSFGAVQGIDGQSTSGVGDVAIEAVGQMGIGLGRKGIAMVFDFQYEEIMNSFNSMCSSNNILSDEKSAQLCLSKAASLLAFRLSPPLIPFFASRHSTKNPVPDTNGKSKKAKIAQDRLAEEHMRRDLLMLEHSLGLLAENKSAAASTTSQKEPFVHIVSQTAAKRLISIILILLRQSFHALNNYGILPKQIENEARLVQLMNQLLKPFHSFQTEIERNKFLSEIFTGNYDLWTQRPSDHYMDMLRRQEGDGASIDDCGLVINLFLCFRDCYAFYCKENAVLSKVHERNDKPMAMDVDEDNGIENFAKDVANGLEMTKLLLQWCSSLLLHFAHNERKEMSQMDRLSLLQLPQSASQLVHVSKLHLGLAMMSSIVFGIYCPDSSWINDQLNICIKAIEQSLGATNQGKESQMNSAKESSHFIWGPVFAHSLSWAMILIPQYCSGSDRRQPAGVNRDRCDIPGLKKCFSFHPTLNPIVGNRSSINIVSFADCAAEAGSIYKALSNQWIEAISDTLNSREVVVMDQVLSLCQSQGKSEHEYQTETLLAYALPVILRYTLQHQPYLAFLTTFAARGENIVSLVAVSDDVNVGHTVGMSFSTEAAIAIKDDDDDEDSDDDGQDYGVPVQQHQQQQYTSAAQQRLNAQNVPPNRRDASSGRYSRADLQTLPKLDSLYQLHVQRSKKISMDGLRALLGDCSIKGTSYSYQKRKLDSLLELAERIGKGELLLKIGISLNSLSPSASSNFWQAQAQKSYFSSLAIVVSSCSGLKAGRNAASPFLAKLAFHDPLLHWLWDYSSQNMPLIMSMAPSPSSFSDVATAFDILVSFCDVFSHHLLAVSDDEFLNRYHPSVHEHCKNQIDAKDLVLSLKNILNDLYWVRPVLASDLNALQQNDPEIHLRFQRARLLLSGTKLWNSLYDRWCRLYRSVQFCNEECWWFPHLASRGQHDSNPIIRSQVTTLDGGDENDVMEESDEDDNGGGSGAGTSPSTFNNPNDAGSDALASSFRDPKMARVLTCIPQALPFSRRVKLFDSLLEADKTRTQDESMAFRRFIQNSEGDDADIAVREQVTIHRDDLYNDSMKSLNPLGKNLRKKVQVTFVNRHGTTEAGIDGGGVFKEFLDDLITDAFLPGDSNSLRDRTNLFTVTSLQTLQVNDNTDGNDALLPHYEFLGRVLGKAIYESILVEPQFCLPFLNKLLGKQNSLDDLKNLDPEYYKNLLSLRHMTPSAINDLCLTFEMTKGVGQDRNGTVELIPGGNKISVTKDNVIQYIHLVSHQRMNVAGARQTHAFLKGFRDLIPGPWVRLFSSYEFQKLVSGDDAIKGIDVKGMMAVTRYSGGFHPSQPIVQWLWEVVDSMDPNQQRKFLKFMTSCSRQPLLGFQSLVPAPCVQQVRLREDDYGNEVAESSSFGNIRLPTSSTCMNLLKLPKYPNKQMLREKLLYAIESAAGFELS